MAGVTVHGDPTPGARSQTTAVDGGGATTGLPEAGPGVPDRPPLPRAVLVARMVFGVLLATAALYAPFYFEPKYNVLLSQALYLAIAAMGLNLLIGFNGQVSIGHGAFFGIGGFTTALLMEGFQVTSEGFHTEGVPAGTDVFLTVNPISFEATLPIAIVLTGVIGLLVGVPALRVRGLYLALVTLALAVLLPQVLNQYVKGVGNTPLVQPRRSEFASLLTFLDNDQWAYFFCLASAGLLFLAARNLVNTRVGRAMVACRDQELAATTLGINLAGTKVGTFAISAAYAGLAGSLSVMVEGQAVAINPALYFRYSIEFLVAMVIGGTATILGPLVGALLLVVLRRNTTNLIEGKEILSPAVFGVALILVMYVLPDGVVGGVRRLTARLVRRQLVAGPTDREIKSQPEEASR